MPMGHNVGKEVFPTNTLLLAYCSRVHDVRTTRLKSNRPFTSGCVLSYKYRAAASVSPLSSRTTTL